MRGRRQVAGQAAGRVVEVQAVVVLADGHGAAAGAVVEMLLHTGDGGGVRGTMEHLGHGDLLFVLCLQLGLGNLPWY